MSGYRGSNVATGGCPVSGWREVLLLLRIFAYISHVRPALSPVSRVYLSSADVMRAKTGLAAAGRDTALKLEYAPIIDNCYLGHLPGEISLEAGGI